MRRKLDWEFWLDCHLSPIVAKWLSDETGYVFKSAYVLALHGLNDIEIYELAKKNSNVILVSKDSDIPDLINRYGAPPKLINLKTGNTHNRILFKFISDNLEAALRKLIDEDIHIVDLES
jgi:predicted nuclease of predicted toxin-antitoxin system